jgi:hypothetical protein
MHNSGFNSPIGSNGQLNVGRSRMNIEQLRVHSEQIEEKKVYRNVQYGCLASRAYTQKRSLSTDLAKMIKSYGMVFPSLTYGSTGFEGRGGNLD